MEGCNDSVASSQRRETAVTIGAINTRDEVIADHSLRGTQLSRALSDATDRWLVDLFHMAIAGAKKSDDVVLIAVGGYGRQELAPQSDLDVLLIHKGVKDISEIASRIWYPVWDAGVKLGHSVRTPKETLQLCTNDLDTATALVTAPHCHMKGPPTRCVGASTKRTRSPSFAGSIECRYSWSSPTNVKSATRLRARASTMAFR